MRQTRPNSWERHQGDHDKGDLCEMLECEPVPAEGETVSVPSNLTSGVWVTYRAKIDGSQHDPDPARYDKIRVFVGDEGEVDALRWANYNEARVVFVAHGQSLDEAIEGARS